MFQRNQDKINAFWEINKKELDDRKAELRNKDREGEEMEERHQVEIKVRTLTLPEQRAQSCSTVKAVKNWLAWCLPW